MNSLIFGFVGGQSEWWRIRGFLLTFLLISHLLTITLSQNSPTNRYMDNNSNRLKKSRVGSRTMRERLLRTEMNQLHENSVMAATATPIGLILNSRGGGSVSGSSDLRQISNNNGNNGENAKSPKSYPSRPASLNSLHKFDPSLTLWDDATSVCHTVPGLTRDQLEICLRTPDATAIAIAGLQMASEECAHQMEKNRWNCSSLQGSINPHNTNLLQKGYRESAFGHAIAAAGVAYAVAKACSQGKLLSCGCGLQNDDQFNYYTTTKDQHLPATMGGMTATMGGMHAGGGVAESSELSLLKQKARGTSSSSWKWSGCSHNMDFGMKFAKIFLDAREKSRDLPSRINLHNNRVGRLAVAGNMEVRCKCHGLSGSCELRTCWRSAPDFRRVGAELKNKFRRAVLIDQSEFGNRPPNRVENCNGGSSNSRQKRRQRRDRRQSKVAERGANIDLWYYEESPTYCDSNRDFNIPGTSGRRCNKTEVGGGSCSTLCCGRGYNTIRQVYTSRCNCQFMWCCQVTCQTCVVDEWITVCK